MLTKVVLTLVSVVVVQGSYSRAQELSCLTEKARADSKLYAHLQLEAYAALDRRAKTYEKLKTPEQIEDYQKRLRRFMTMQFGGVS